MGTRALASPASSMSATAIRQQQGGEPFGSTSPAEFYSPYQTNSKYPPCVFSGTKKDLADLGVTTKGRPGGQYGIVTESKRGWVIDLTPGRIRATAPPLVISPSESRPGQSHRDNQVSCNVVVSSCLANKSVICQKMVRPWLSRLKNG